MRDYIGVPYGVQKFYSGSVVKIAGKISFKVYICPETVMSELATESIEDNIIAFRALVWHMNEANRVAEGDADFMTVQEIPGGGSSSEQV